MEKVLREHAAAIGVGLSSKCVVVCAACGSTLDERGDWKVAGHVSMPGLVSPVSHVLCPVCAKKMYAEYLR